MQVNLETFRLVDFIAATENEIAVDKMVFALAGMMPEKIGFLPRLPKWVNFGRRFPALSFWLWWIIRNIWLTGGSHVFFIGQFVPLWYRAKRKNVFKNGVIENSGYVLALSSRVGQIVHSRHISNLPTAWITVPWAPLTKIPENARRINIFSLLDKRDLFQALRNAIVATSVLRQRNRTSTWVLHSYTAFRWFAVRAALGKLSGSFLMAEHYDRWAILVDGSIQEDKYFTTRAGKSNKRELVLVQHGTIGELGVDNGFICGERLKLRRKLRSVTQLYAYDVEAERVFKQDILSLSCSKNGVRVLYYLPEIELKNDYDCFKLNILFVGHSHCEELHTHIFSSLIQQFEFNAFYKPHPLSPMSNRLSSIGWRVIHNSEYFPLVDLLIAYPSTLVVEYAGKGIPGLVHPINLAKAEADEFIKSVCKKIESLQASK